MSYKHSDYTKKIISEKRKEWLANNKDKHPWKSNNKFISKPCEKLKEDLLKNSIIFECELQPLTDRYFSIDIAILEKGIGIEINGNQHYNSDKTLKSYYQERKKLIEEKGWKLYDIHYSKVYDEEFITELVKLINGHTIDINLDFNLKVKNINKCIDCNNIISNKSTRCITCHNISRRTDNYYKEKKIKEKKEISYCKCGSKKTNISNLCNKCYSISRRIIERPSINQLEVDIDKLGYSGTGRKYGVSDNTIRKWIKNGLVS